MSSNIFIDTVIFDIVIAYLNFLKIWHLGKKPLFLGLGDADRISRFMRS